MRQAGKGKLGTGGRSVRQNPGRENPCQGNCAGDPIPPRPDPGPPPRRLLVSPALPHAWRTPPDLPVPCPVRPLAGLGWLNALRIAVLPRAVRPWRDPAVFHDPSQANRFLMEAKG